MGGIVVEHTASGITLVNNISAFNQGAGIRGYFSEEDHQDDEVGIRNVVHGNLVYANGGYGNLHTDPVVSGPSAGARILHFGRNIVADPRFLAAPRWDFRLRRDSPALGRAVPRYAPPFDRRGQPRRKRSSIDLGAFERL